MSQDQGAAGAAASPGLHGFQFGRFDIWPQERALRVDGQPVALRARAFDVLLVLARNSGRLVRKSDLMTQVWPGRVVEDNSIAVHVSQLRKVLGGDAITTVPGLGYRLVGPVLQLVAPEPAGLPWQAPEALPAHAAPQPPSPQQAEQARADQASTAQPPVDQPMIGRGQALATLHSLLDLHRLVCITGAGGMGKTLLARHLLQQRRGQHRHGVCWVELAQAADASALPDLIAAALGVPTTGPSAMDNLFQAVAPLHLLLVLDNAEHLVDEVAALTQRLLQAGAGLTVLVTSQAPLQLPLERVFKLAALDCPDAGVGPAAALEFGAVALFVDRAQAADAQFVLTHTNVAPVIGICHALGSLPLAIELAAARTQMLGVAHLADAMHEQLQLLTRNRNRQAPARQQSLRSTLAWSHDRLQPREQQVFRRLGVLAGSASLALLQGVVVDTADQPALDAWAALDAIGTLVDRSLVMLVRTGDDNRPRYRLLAAVQAFALERLAEAQEVQTTQRRHAQTLCQLADAAWPDMDASRCSVEQWHANWAPDMEQGRQAFTWCCANNAPALALPLGAWLLSCLPRGQHRERMALVQAMEARLHTPLPHDTHLHVLLELTRASLNHRQDRSLQLATQALALARVLDTGAADRVLLFRTLGLLALAAFVARQPALADDAFAELCSLVPPDWPARRRAQVAYIDSQLHMMRRNHAAALLALRRAVQLYSLAGDTNDVALTNLVDHELAAGEVAAAIQNGQALVATLDSRGNAYSLSFARGNLVAALLAADDATQAHAVALQGWPQATRFGHQANWLPYLALMAALQGRPAAAAQLLGLLHAKHQQADDRLDVNHVAAVQRCTHLAQQVLGATTFGVLKLQGGALTDSDVAGLVF